MSELKNCPMCGGAAEVHEMDDYFMAACECGVCYEGPTSSDCVSAWNRRAPAVSEDGLPPLPEPHSHIYPVTRQPNNYPVYTAEQVRQAQRDAVAADRAARGMVPSQVKSPEQPASAAQVVIEWQFRIPPGTDYGSKEHIGAMKAEIADLRARLAGLSQEDA